MGKPARMYLKTTTKERVREVLLCEDGWENAIAFINKSRETAHMEYLLIHSLDQECISTYREHYIISLDNFFKVPVSKLSSHDL